MSVAGEEIVGIDISPDAIHVAQVNKDKDEKWILDKFSYRLLDSAKIGNNLFNGVANFGKRPTVDGTKLLLEVHLFEFDENIYGKDLTVEFLTFIRDEKKFESFTLLTKQIHQDIQIAKDYHSKN